MMNYRSLFLISAALLTGNLCPAQDIGPASVEDFRPSTLNQPGKQYPQVNSEGRVRAKHPGTTGFEGYSSILGALV